jgi:hypothetical protein
VGWVGTLGNCGVKVLGFVGWGRLLVVEIKGLQNLGLESRILASTSLARPIA